jgi:uracil-DNA glycosylase
MENQEGRIIGFSAISNKSNVIYPSLVLIHPDYHNRNLEQMKQMLSESMKKLE